jgi:O-antigen ligase
MNSIKHFKQTINYEKVYYYLILLFAFSMPLSRALLSLVVILLPLIWIVEGNFKKKYIQIKSNRVLLVFLLYILISISSFFWTSNTTEGLHALRLLLYFIIIYVIATSLKTTYIDNIISAFLSGMFISEMIAYGVFFKLWHFNNATPENPSPFMFHIDYSVFLAFTSILMLYRAMSNKYSFIERIFFSIFFFTVTGNLFLAVGRTGQVALIAALIVLSLLRYKFSFKSIVMSLLLIGGIFSLGYNMSNTFQKRSHMAVQDIRGIANMNLNSSWGIRVAYWIATYNIVKKHPFGVGLGDYKDAVKSEIAKEKYTKLLNNNSKRFMALHHPHNQYLLILLQSGIIGLLAFFYFIYSFFTMKIENKEFKELSILFATIYFVSSFAEPLLIKQFTIALFILFVGLFVNASIQNTKDNCVI